MIDYYLYYKGLRLESIKIDYYKRTSQFDIIDNDFYYIGNETNKDKIIKWANSRLSEEYKKNPDDLKFFPLYKKFVVDLINKLFTEKGYIEVLNEINGVLGKPFIENKKELEPKRKNHSDGEQLILF